MQNNKLYSNSCLQRCRKQVPLGILKQCSVKVKIDICLHFKLECMRAYTENNYLHPKGNINKTHASHPLLFPHARAVCIPICN